MNGDLFLQTMKHFVEKTRPDKDNPIVSLLDNTDSHLDVHVVDLCKRSGIRMNTFPPHCLHKMQPLDVVVFFHFKWELKQKMNI